MIIDKIVAQVAFKWVPKTALCLTIFPLFLTMPNTVSGQSARIPEFSFKRMSDGSDFTRNNLSKGKKTFFLFFDTECPHCRVAVSTWNQNTALLSGLNTVLVTMDKPSEVLPFLQKNASRLLPLRNLALVQDMNRQFIARFLPKKYPAMFLYSESGSLMHYTDEEKDIPYIIGLIRKK